MWVRRKKKPGKTAGKVTVSAFVNGWCPAQNLYFERARRAAGQFGADGLFVDGKQVRTGPPPSFEKIKGLIGKRAGKLK